MKMYPDNEAAQRQFEAWRWGADPRCPHCDSYRISLVSHPVMPYRCKDCRKHFSVRTKTIMAKSQLDYQQWLAAVYIAATGIKGTSSTRLASELGITQKSGWYLGQRIRKAWEVDNRLDGTVEIDETYIGDKEDNKHANKKTGTRTANKIAVVGIVQRGGEVRAQIMDANKTEVTRFIRKNVKEGATIYTDASILYTNLPKYGYTHRSVNHSRGEYVRSQVHTNTIEGFWANFKRGYYGTHHHMSKKHIQRYVAEFTARQNVRRCDTIDQMRQITKGMFGRSLPYKRLIA